MTTDPRIQEIKNRLRLEMNGVASKSMRDGGLNYGLNFGVGLQSLKRIAGETAHDASLAIALWKENIRECKMLAALLYPVSEFGPDMADLWVSEIRWPDLAQVCCMYLFSRIDNASVMAFRWIASDGEMARYCGFLTISHLLRQGREMSPSYVCELKDQANAAIQEGQTLVAMAASTALECMKSNGEE
ncbi:MAG: DNA alkylation repair protein [Bacteroidaceae bacterium]|nr:DNA alkylation repair protein [Bacteroidaceae bacterium]